MRSGDLGRLSDQSTTTMPMLRQVPATWLIAASMVAAVRSGILRYAISRTCALVMVPTLFLLGTPEPFS